MPQNILNNISIIKILFYNGRRAKYPAKQTRTFMERLKNKYPDDNFDDEEALYGRLGEDYDNAENEIAEYKKHEDVN